MKRISKYLLLCVLAMISTAASALSKDSINAVTMVAYEQSWLDNNGTLALQNNTNESIHDISFMLKYYDMNGHQIDYKEFDMDVDIDPGMTKKIDVPAYEHRRYYHYYKTKDEFGHPAFKMEFELKDYNAPPKDIIKETESLLSGKGSSFWDELANNFSAILAVAFALAVYILPGVMASKRGRSVIGWILLEIMFTPLASIILLLALGKKMAE